MRKTRPSHLLRSLLLSLGALAACSETKVLDELTVTPIGQSGGVATSADGLFALEFPAGALATTVEVQILTVRSLVPTDVIGPIYDLSDNSFTFGGAPRIRMSAAEGAPGYEIVEVGAAGVSAVEGSVEDELTRKVSAPFKRHGRYARRRHVHPRVDAGTIADAGTGTVTLDAGSLDSGTGTGTISLALCADVGAIDFGAVIVGQQATREVSLRNCGLQPLTVGSVFVTGSTVGFSMTDTSPSHLNPGQSTTRAVVFRPGAVGFAQGSLIAQGSGGVSTTVWLSGQGYQPAGHCDLFTNTGTCTVDVLGMTEFQSPSSTNDLQVRVDAGTVPTGCQLGLSVVGLGFTGALTSTLGGALLPLIMNVTEAEPVTVQVTYVATGTSAMAGALRVEGTLGSSCVVPLTVP